jgi:hypothetical protein
VGFVVFRGNKKTQDASDRGWTYNLTHCGWKLAIWRRRRVLKKWTRRVDDQESRRWRGGEEEKVGVWAWGSTTNQAKRNVQGGEDVPIGVSVIGPVRWGSGDLTLAGTARTTL